MIIGIGYNDAMRTIRHSSRIHARFIARCCLSAIIAIALATLAAPQYAGAQRLDNGVAVFAALDKVTAKIRRLEVPLDETVTFGALKVTPRVCYSRPPTERPKTTSFVQINEVELDGSEKKIFSGWMFAESPGLNAVEHPVFDIWLTGCEKPANAPPAVAPETEGAALQPGPDEAQPASRPRPRRRPRRRVRR